MNVANMKTQCIQQQQNECRQFYKKPKTSKAEIRL